MLKAVVFDDEYIVLQGLKMMIDWSRYGIELAGTASDGLEALRLFKEVQPDIVLTDIRMPGLDGLEVIEKIMDEAPGTVCIVFSGFNEVEYLKKAIKLGVIDYLEKPVTLSMVEEVLTKTIKKINEQKRMEKLQVEWEGTKMDRLEKATLDLLLTGSNAEEKWRQEFGPNVDRIKAVTILALSDECTFTPNQPDYELVYIRNGHERLIAVFHYTENPEELIQQLISWPGNITIGSGRTYSEITSAPRSYGDAQHALRYGLFMEESGWIRFEDIGENTRLPRQLSQYEKNIIFNMRTGDEAGLLSELEQFIRELESQKLNPDVLESEVLKLIYLAQEVAKETGEDIHQLKEGGYFPQQDIRAIQTKEQLFHWLYAQMNLIMQWILRIRTSEKQGAVERACSYMESRFDQDITLQEVAEYVGMNSTYFSLLFKEKVGKSYIKYLTHIRMERAKELLLAGGKVAEVSERVGYRSYRHFSELFRKHTSVNPGQYKERST
ncbi:response regulator [Domibacillus sp. PGB-M46]|uniref:response regulator transcription factor n=1 Tax=Domibacillus sp. PGB-M46 TaxID=2910255 RepID=UPI001F584620|nr:response regulator [Domibacillus sp. PGB-M46]MCI2255771.1 response regulator [Domibacillus sp. PGB-M46]